MNPILCLPFPEVVIKKIQLPRQSGKETPGPEDRQDEQKANVCRFIIDCHYLILHLFYKELKKIRVESYYQSGPVSFDFFFLRNHIHRVVFVILVPIRSVIIKLGQLVHKLGLQEGKERVEFTLQFSI